MGAEFQVALVVASVNMHSQGERRERGGREEGETSSGFVVFGDGPTSSPRSRKAPREPANKHSDRSDKRRLMQKNDYD